MTDNDAARELYLYTINTSPLYFQQTLPIVRNLAKKRQRGVYDHQKALKLWANLATRAAKAYNAEFGADDTPWWRIFPPDVRAACAGMLAASYEEHIQEAIDGTL